MSNATGHAAMQIASNAANNNQALRFGGEAYYPEMSEAPRALFRINFVRTHYAVSWDVIDNDAAAIVLKGLKIRLSHVSVDGQEIRAFVTQKAGDKLIKAGMAATRLMLD